MKENNYWYIYETHSEIPEGAIAKCMRGMEVVRCKDCKYNVANWHTQDTHNDPLNITDYTDITCDYFMTDGMEANDFCSKGEKVDVN